MSLSSAADLINPSLICADHLDFYSDLDVLADLDIGKLHIDVMDNIYVPRFGLYPEIVERIQQCYEFRFDIHLMVSDVSGAIRQWTEYTGPVDFTMHMPGDEDQLLSNIELIKSRGCRYRLAFGLSESASKICSAIREYEPAGIMLLGIKPGVLKQKHRPDLVIDKLRELSRAGVLSGLNVQVDGGVNFRTLGLLKSSGATDLVCGSSSLFACTKGLRGSERATKIRQNFAFCEQELMANV